MFPDVTRLMRFFKCNVKPRVSAFPRFTYNAIQVEWHHGGLQIRKRKATR